MINGLWLGEDHLSPLEILTLKSFTHFGCEFHLWTYKPVKNKLPAGVVIRDGREILPQHRIFRYPEEMLLGFGGRSFVGFSEIFRYKVLYDLGGWWSDMDVTLLKPLDIEDEYFFRIHGVLSVVGNIMKVPPKSELMKLCYERASLEVNEHQNDWYHAIRILCYYIEFLGLSKYIRADVCNLDRLDHILPFIQQPGSLSEIPQNWYFIHWMNSVLDKKYKPGSIYEQLLKMHDCQERTLLLI
jgi:hypothetical protein